MENKSSKMLMPALTYAGIIVGIMIVHSIVIDIMGLNLSRYNRIAGTVLPLIGIGYAIFAFRKEYNNNLISYSRAFGFGVLVTVITAILISAFNVIYVTYINPDLIEAGRQMAEERMLERGFSPEMIERGMKNQERFSTPGYMFLFSTLITMVLGTIFSLIAAAVLKKESDNPFEGVE